ncbi:MAG: TetR/AcrR family transcriptional regulator [Fretibacterium sp.]|nr:TetR/AcrR family transcriptional regulator [Fretibacterium sp.]
MNTVSTAQVTRRGQFKKSTRRERFNLKPEKRHRLVEAAIEEFNDYGLDNASYNRIIERSGLSKGSVYYYFDNKDALMGAVMEDIGTRVLEAVPERPLPETREEFWPAVWDYRKREFDFFASNVALGRVLILSLGNNEPETEEHVEEVCPPLVRLIRRQKAMIARGQKLGAVRNDLSVDVILKLMGTVDRSLCVQFFGRNVEDIEKLSPAEREERSRDYTRLFQDLIHRLLEPGEFTDSP